MNYTMSNKEAWEEAFDNRSEGWCDDIGYRLEHEKFPFIEKVLVDELVNYDMNNKSIAQFCCNNGRELLNLMKFGALKGVGFDLAENMVSFANTTAKNLGINCTFVATDILEIDERFHNYFDFIFVTIGALTWFSDLSKFFNKVSLCLKQGGILIINETHPIANMLGLCGEDNYDSNAPDRLVNSYFKNEPWIENSGMGYMTGKIYESKTFYSYSHTFSHIINSITQNKMYVKKLLEFDHDISSLFQHLVQRGIPLSFILISQKHE